MDAQAHLRFIKNMIAQLQTQADEIEAAIKREFDAAQTPLFPMSPEVVAFHCGDRPIGGSITPALPIADDGWIEWDGGMCPVCGSSRVDVRFSDGQQCLGVYADNWAWGKLVSEKYRIVAYRLSAVQK
jgi:asparagine synthetase A